MMRFRSHISDTSHFIKKLVLLTRKHHGIMLFVILAFAACIRIIFFAGIGNVDSLAYAENANAIVQRTFKVSDYIHKLRLGLILPTTLFYRLWEANEISSALYPLICSLGSIFLIFSMSKLLFADVTSALISALLLALFPMEVFYSSQLMPEIPLSFLMALCVHFFLKGEQVTERQKAKWYYLASGIMAGFAYMIKIFAVFLVLFFLCYILYRRRLTTAYVWMTVGFCCVWLPEMVFYYTQTGNPLYRIATIISSPGRGAHPNPGKMYRKDLFLYPYYWFVSLYHFGFFFYFIILAFFYALWCKLRETYIPMLWAGALFLYLQFGREGKYLIHKEARFLSIITIPCLLVLGYVLTRMFYRRKRLILWIIIGFLGVTSLVFISFQQTLRRTEFANLRATAHYLQQLPDEIEVYIDDASAQYVYYFLGYKTSLKLFSKYNHRTGENTYPIDLNQIHQAFVVVNWHMINTFRYMGIIYIEYPEIIYNPPSYWEMVHTIQPSDNWIYFILRVLQNSSLIRYLPEAVSQKMAKTITRVLKSHKEKTIIYRIDYHELYTVSSCFFITYASSLLSE